PTTLAHREPDGGHSEHRDIFRGHHTDLPALPAADGAVAPSRAWREAPRTATGAIPPRCHRLCGRNHCLAMTVQHSADRVTNGQQPPRPEKTAARCCRHCRLRPRIAPGAGRTTRGAVIRVDNDACQTRIVSVPWDGP